MSDRPTPSIEQRNIMRRRQADRVEALGRLEGRLLLDIEEQIGSCMKWPPRFTEAMLSTHLHFPERWQLTLFLLGNRCPPSLMVEWYMKRGMLKDKSARDQVADIIRQHRDGALESKGITTWVMGATDTKPLSERKHKWDGVGDPAQDKQQTIATPTFAFDFMHEWHWTEAIKMLKAGYSTCPVEPPVPTPVKKRELDSPRTERVTEQRKS